MSNDRIFYVMLLPLTITISPQRQQYRIFQFCPNFPSDFLKMSNFCLLSPILYEFSNFVHIFQLYQNVRFLSFSQCEISFLNLYFFFRQVCLCDSKLLTCFRGWFEDLTFCGRYRNSRCNVPFIERILLNKPIVFGKAFGKKSKEIPGGAITIGDDEDPNTWLTQPLLWTFGSKNASVSRRVHAAHSFHDLQQHWIQKCWRMWELEFGPYLLNKWNETGNK